MSSDKLEAKMIELCNKYDLVEEELLHCDPKDKHRLELNRAELKGAIKLLKVLMSEE